MYFTILSFILISLVTIGIFLLSFVTAVNSYNVIIGFLNMIFLMLLTYEIKNEFLHNVLEKKEYLKIKNNIVDFIKTSVIVSISGMLTFILNNKVGLESVTASSIVGILGVILLEKYQMQIFCGSFVGMASSNVFVDYRHVFMATVMADIIFNGLKYEFIGFGGKLGAIAFISTMLVSIFLGKEFDISTVKYLREGFININVISLFVLGGITTYYLNEKTKLGSVLSSSIIGLLGSAILLNIIGSKDGKIFIMALYSGTFIGMTTKNRIPEKKYIILASIVAAIIYNYTQSVFIGLGGKLGIIGFGAVIAVSGFLKAFRIKRIKSEE